MSHAPRRGVAAILGLVVLSAILAWVAALAFGGTERLHPSLRWALAMPSAPRLGDALPVPLGDDLKLAVPLPALLEPLLSGWGTLDVLVKVDRTISGMRFLGIPIQVNTGTVLGLAVTLGELLRLAATPEVVYVEPAWRVEPKIDISLPAVGMAYIRSAYPELRGEGVILGLVDTGIDHLHLDFRYDRDGDGFEESSRIAALWDQTDGFFGTRYTRQDIEADIAAGLGPAQGIVHQEDDDGHGTRVAGILVSDGSSSSAGLAGIAPEAELVAVKTPFYTSDILAGVEYIFEHATARGLPAVVNLSLGGHAGAHDGTSLFEQGLDELVDRPGRVVVVSAGNEGDELIHVSRQLYGGSTGFALAPRGGTLEFSLWYPGDGRFDIAAALPGGDTLVVPYGSSGSASTTGGDLYIDNATAGTNPNNGYHEATFRLSGSGFGQQWPVTVTATAGGGRFHGWITSGDGEIIGGDMTHTIAEPGNARRAITVGSFNSRAQWNSLDGFEDFSAAYPAGALTSFSSRGPTMDGRQKPELTAPGAWIVSTRSASAFAQDYLIYVDGVHEASVGTSFSAPHVAGVAALILSINPTLSWWEVLALLRESAGEDAFTPPLPDPRWGYGKLNAASAIPSVLPPPDDDDDDDDGDGEPIERIAVELSANPVSDQATFLYELPTAADWARLRIYTVHGRLIFDSDLDPEGERFDWALDTLEGDAAGSGLYLFRLVTDVGRSSVERLVILR
jgi:subtilisin family serine protease